MAESENSPPNARIDSDIHMLAQYGMTSDLKRLITTNPETEIHTKNSNGFTCLVLAVKNGYLDMVNELLEIGLDIETPSGENDMRPLHFACNGFQTNMVQLLLEKGASAKSKDKISNTPLHFAAARGVANIIALLDKADADVNATNNYGATPLHKACIYGQISVVNRLLKMGADVNIADSDGNTALHFASKVGFASITKLLLENGANVKAANKLYEKPPDVALTDAVRKEFA